MRRRDKVALTKRGRPPGTHTLSPERSLAIVSAIRAGNHITTACHLAGVSTSTFYRWMARAGALEDAIDTGQPWDRTDLVYRNFRDDALRARAEAAAMMVGVVHRAVVGGELIAEKPALDGAGNPIRDADGWVVMERKWTQPDGRLALAFLRVAQPSEWAGCGGLGEAAGLTGQTGVGSDDAPDRDTIARLASRLAEVVAQQRGIAAEHDPTE